MWWPLSKNLISQMEKQHLLSYRLRIWRPLQLLWTEAGTGGRGLDPGGTGTEGLAPGTLSGHSAARPTLSRARWTCIWNEATKREGGREQERGGGGGPICVTMPHARLCTSHSSSHLFHHIWEIRHFPDCLHSEFYITFLSLSLSLDIQVDSQAQTHTHTHAN